MEKLVHKAGKAVVPTKFDLDFALKLGYREWNGLKEIFDLLYAYQETKLTPEAIIRLNTFEGSQIEKLLEKVAQLQKWVNDLQSGMYVNCVYCGYRYGPADEMPVSMGDMLKEHIEHCPEHPMSKLKEEVERLREAQENPQPLTLEQLRERDGKPAYSPQFGWGVIGFRKIGTDEHGGYDKRFTFGLSYGWEWLDDVLRSGSLYDYPPKEAQT
jgi:hypothetical protein